MGEKRSSFVVSTDWKRFLDKMTDEQAGQFIKAIFSYQIDGVEYSGEDPRVDTAFIAVQTYIDANNAHYENVCRKRAEAGRKGGSSKKQAITQETSDKQNKQLLSLLDFDKQTQASESKAKHSESESESESESDIKETDKEKTTPADDLSRVVSHYMDVIDPNITPTIASFLRTYLQDMDVEVIIEAMEEAVNNNARRWAYIKSILLSWRGQGIRDVKSLDSYRRLSNGRKKQSDGTRRDTAVFNESQLQEIVVIG